MRKTEGARNGRDPCRHQRRATTTDARGGRSPVVRPGSLAVGLGPREPSVLQSLHVGRLLLGRSVGGREAAGGPPRPEGPEEEARGGDRPTGRRPAAAADVPPPPAPPPLLLPSLP